MRLVNFSADPAVLTALALPSTPPTLPSALKAWEFGVK